MTLRLEPAIDVGGWRAAALCEQAIAVACAGGAMVATAHKRPVAILLAREGVVTAFAPDGLALDVADLERRCPGAVEAVTGPPRGRT